MLETELSSSLHNKVVFRYVSHQLTNRLQLYNDLYAYCSSYFLPQDVAVALHSSWSFCIFVQVHASRLLQVALVFVAATAQIKPDKTEMNFPGAARTNGIFCNITIVEINLASRLCNETLADCWFDAYRWVSA